MSDSTNAHCRDLLPWYAAGMLSPEEHETVAQHLAACASCQNELTQWQAIGSASKRMLQQVNPEEASDTSWSRLQSALSADQPLDGKHTHTRGEVYMEFKNQTSHSTAIAQRHSVQRPILAMVIVSLFVIMSVVGFALFALHHGGGNVGQQPSPIASSYLTNASLVTPNHAAQTPLSPPKTSKIARDVNGQLQITGETAHFQIGDTVNVSTHVQGAKANDIVSIKWFFNDTDLTPSLQGESKCCSIVMTDVKPHNIIFTLLSPKTGVGKAEIYYNDTLAYTVVFDVASSGH